MPKEGADARGVLERAQMCGPMLRLYVNMDVYTCVFVNRIQPCEIATVSHYLRMVHAFVMCVYYSTICNRTKPLSLCVYV